MKKAVIVSAVRTAIGNFGGAISTVSAIELGSIVIKEAVKRAGIEAKDVDEVIMGIVFQAGLGQHPARQAAIGAGLPVEVSSLTINKVCGSSLKAVALAAQSIGIGDADVVVAGGMENMSQAPYLLERARWGYRMGEGKLVDSMIQDGLWDVFNDYHMGMTAENLAEKYGITREMQDKFAAHSQEKCRIAYQESKFADEIVPVKVPQRKGSVLDFKQDEFPKPETTAEKLVTLKPAFKKDGTVTAGNASGINDGAAAVIVMSADKAEELGLEPLAEIVSCGSVGVEPSIMGIGPVSASRKALSRAGLNMDDIDLFELNEAFAAQSVAVIKELGCDETKVNVNGGAIALGHPIGASGARILVTLLYEMKKCKSRYGLAALCIGSGEGIAMVVKRE